ncbi:LOW QUALITY PROTEIN: hypothetical protein QTO34_003051 [Cnephaeus nilssonii]|uniref:CPL domain-containing protein n=1 Tax=Cnephaeus nilssonii TaxID=3371016 RepID=A0AA40LLY0_CNENI|nr:LOW QUALITY PROTEIN: hypothetical protein QTO34_003051 [Eptesicus nilssonii]
MTLLLRQSRFGGSQEKTVTKKKSAAAYLNGERFERCSIDSRKNETLHLLIVILIMAMKNRENRLLKNCEMEAHTRALRTHLSSFVTLPARACPEVVLGKSACVLVSDFLGTAIGEGQPALNVITSLAAGELHPGSKEGELHLAEHPTGHLLLQWLIEQNKKPSPEFIRKLQTKSKWIELIPHWKKHTQKYQQRKRWGLGPRRWPWARRHPTSLLRIAGAHPQWFTAIRADCPLVPKAGKASAPGFPGLGLRHTPMSLQRFPGGAAFLPSHAAQRPGADVVVRNACVIAMATMQASRPAPGLSAPTTEERLVPPHLDVTKLSGEECQPPAAEPAQPSCRAPEDSTAGIPIKPVARSTGTCPRSHHHHSHTLMAPALLAFTDGASSWCKWGRCFQRYKWWLLPHHPQEQGEVEKPQE